MGLRVLGPLTLGVEFWWYRVEDVQETTCPRKFQVSLAVVAFQEEVCEFTQLRLPNV